MDYIINFPSRDLLLNNFRNCMNWEEKYLYIIDLGYHLPQISKDMESQKYLVPGCQSKVWIVLSTVYIKNHKKKIVKFYGNSDSSITKGIVCIIFIIYQGLTVEELIHHDPYPFLHELDLTNHLTYSRSQGIKSILQFIHHQAKVFF